MDPAKIQHMFFVYTYFLNFRIRGCSWDVEKLVQFIILIHIDLQANSSIIRNDFAFFFLLKKFFSMKFSENLKMSPKQQNGELKCGGLIGDY